MKAIILAAGQGSRFHGLTSNMPKCMLHFAGQPLLHHQLRVLAEAGITDITVVKGYLGDKVETESKVYWNYEYASSNMVVSLLAAEVELYGDVLVSYGDLVYDGSFLDAVLSATVSEVGVVIDLEWRKYFEARFDDPFIDAESLLLSDDQAILDIGRKMPSEDEVMGQYVGVTRLTANGCRALLDLTSELRKNRPDWRYRGKSFAELYMTDLLQLLVDGGVDVHAIPIANGWLEFDSRQDLERAEDWWRSGTLKEFVRLPERH